MQNHLNRRNTSMYLQPFPDPKAITFSPERFPLLNDPQADVSEALQQAIDQVKEAWGFGVVFIPEGTYFITKTVFIPKAIRLIGFGTKRPKFVLRPSSPDFQAPAEYDLGNAHYMFWFTGRPRGADGKINDANPGTFYSAISNIDFEVGPGNPCAAVIRAHFAQHCFVSHCNFNIGQGKAGIVEVGNEMENLSFTGGDYGIITGKCSPGWPFLLADSSFSGQKKAAIHTKEGGLVLVRTEVSHCPTVIEVQEEHYEKLYIEDSRFDGISGPALVLSRVKNSMTQINLRHIACRNVPVFARLRETGETTAAPVEGAALYLVEAYTHGFCKEEASAPAQLVDELRCTTLSQWPEAAKSDLPNPPREWKSVALWGAAGDGLTDDTQALQKAAASGEAVYFPQGFYLVSDTITLAPETSFLGMNPISTQILLADDTPAFSGFGTPKPLLETSSGRNLVSGLGLNTAGRNPRAVGCRWVANEASYMNDVKFLGGHGTMRPGEEFSPVYNPSRTGDVELNYLWDSQYWSLWITENGGGVMKDVWSASPYAEAGIYLSDTEAPGRMYAVSVEHHVRSEIKMKRVKNWKFYAVQTEEEVAESSQCQPLELIDCEDLLFVNFYAFRVVWVCKPFSQALLSWGSHNVEILNAHNYTQTPYTMENLAKEQDSGQVVREWELAKLVLKKGKEKAPVPGESLRELGSGFTFAGSLCQRKNGTLYFCDDQDLYEYNPETDCLRPLMKIHLKPIALFCDTKDNLVVAGWRKLPASQQRPFGTSAPEDSRGSSFHGYMRDMETGVYTIDPENPERTMAILTPGPAPAGKPSAVYYPAHRWHDGHDYLQAMAVPCKSFYTAPDGKTFLADTWDLQRTVCLEPARPGEFFYGVDEYEKRTVRFSVTEDGSLSSPADFAEAGEFSAEHRDRKVYVADGSLFVYGEDGTLLRRLEFPQRPVGTLLSQDGRTLYITTGSALYSYLLEER